MRSLSRGSIAGNYKLRGKRSQMLGCGCCVIQNLKLEYKVSEAEKEIQMFKKHIPSNDGSFCDRAEDWDPSQEEDGNNWDELL